MALEDVIRGSGGRAPAWGVSEDFSAGLNGEGIPPSLKGRGLYKDYLENVAAPVEGDFGLHAVGEGSGRSDAGEGLYLQKFLGKHPLPSALASGSLGDKSNEGGAGKYSAWTSSRLEQASKKIKVSLPRDMRMSDVMKSSRWQSWQSLLDSIYSKERWYMIEGILNNCRSIAT